MKSRWIINLLLLSAIAALSLIAHFEPGIEKPPRAAAITPFETGEVHRIHLNRPLREDLVLVKKDAHWEIERATPLPADKLKIGVLTRLAEQIPVRSYPAADMNLDALQLDPPYATAILNDIAIEFGNLEPIDDLRYVRVGDRVHLIPDRHLQLMETSYSQFVRRRLFPDGAVISAIRMPGVSVTRADNTWVADPASAVASGKLQALVDAWQSASALYVQAAGESSDTEVIEISLEGSTTPVRFLVAAREPDLVLVRPDYGVQYRMNASAATLLSPNSASAPDDES